MDLVFEKGCRCLETEFFFNRVSDISDIRTIFGQCQGQADPDILILWRSRSPAATLRLPLPQCSVMRVDPME